MSLPISRDTYIKSEDQQTGRGMTYDLFEMLHKGMTDLKTSIGGINGKIIDFEKRIVGLEERPVKKTGTAIVIDKVLTKPKSAIMIIISVGLAFGIGIGTIALSDINLLKLLK